MENIFLGWFCFLLEVHQIALFDTTLKRIRIIKNVKIILEIISPKNQK